MRALRAPPALLDPEVVAKRQQYEEEERDREHVLESKEQIGDGRQALGRAGEAGDRRIALAPADEAASGRLLRKER